MLPSGDPFLLQQKPAGGGFVYNGPDSDGALALSSLETSNGTLAVGAGIALGFLGVGEGLIAYEGGSAFISWITTRLGITARALQQVLETTKRTSIGPYPYGSDGSVILLPKVLGGAGNAVIDPSGSINIIGLTLQKQLVIVEQAVRQGLK